MILILILSDTTYNFEIRLLLWFIIKKTCIGPKTILSVERSVCWRVVPKSVGPIICPRFDVIMFKIIATKLMEEKDVLEENKYLI